jgi:hypothetical protein
MEMATVYALYVANFILKNIGFLKMKSATMLIQSKIVFKEIK